MTSVRSVQLSVRGKPSAFDLSTDSNMMVVASPGCLTFFDIDGLGAPKHFIYYEQPQQVRRIRYQKNGILAALRGGSVSLWDPAHSLRPLLGFIQDSGWITNLEWSAHSTNILSTCCDEGDAKVWDARSPNQAVQSMRLGGVCQKISWGKFDPNYLAVSNLNKIGVFDTRMVGSKSMVSYYESSEGVLQFAWSPKEYQSMLIATSDGTLECRGAMDFSADPLVVRNAVDEASLLFSTPVGQCAVVCKYDYVSNTPQSQPFGAGSKAAQAKDTPVTPPGGAAAAGGTDNSKKVSVNLVGFPDRENSKNSEGRISQLAQCPDPVLGVRWGTSGRLIPPMHNGLEMLFLSTSSCLHAVKIPAEFIQDHCPSLKNKSKMPQQKSTTSRGAESSTQTKLDPPHYCITGLRRYVTPVASNIAATENKPAAGQSSAVLQHSAITEGSLNLSRSLALSGEFWAILQEGVLQLEQKLQSGLLEGLSLGVVDKYARQITLHLTRPEVSPFAPSKRPGAVDADSSPRDTSNRKIDMEGLSLDKSNHSEDIGGNALSDDERALNDSLVNESNTTNKKSRKKGTVDLQKKDERDRADRSKAKVATLIISFPPSYPQRGVPTFTLRGAGLASSGSQLRSDLVAEMISIAKGATQSAENAFSAMGVVQSAKFLYDVSDCFRCRTLQYWGAKAQTPAAENLAIIGGANVGTGSTKALKWIESDATSDIGLDIDDMVDDNGASAYGKPKSAGEADAEKKGSASKQKRAKKTEPEVEVSSKAAEIIEPLAYCVPCPPSSGFAISPSGVLVTFGGANLMPKLISSYGSSGNSAASSNNRDGAVEKKAWAMNIYPKSYADLLLRQREREFYLSEDLIDDEVQVKTSKKKLRKPKQSIIHSSSGGSIVELTSSVSSDNLERDNGSSDDYSADEKSSKSGSDEDSSEAEDSSRDTDSNCPSPEAVAPENSLKSDQEPVSFNIADALNTNPLMAWNMNLDTLGETIDQALENKKKGKKKQKRDSPSRRHSELRISGLKADPLQISSDNPGQIAVFDSKSQLSEYLSEAYALGPGVTFQVASDNHQATTNVADGDAVLFAALRKDNDTENTASTQIQAPEKASRLRSVISSSKIRSPDLNDAKRADGKLSNVASTDSLRGMSKKQSSESLSSSIHSSSEPRRGRTVTWGSETDNVETPGSVGTESKGHVRRPSDGSLASKSVSTGPSNLGSSLTNSHGYQIGDQFSISPATSFTMPYDFAASEGSDSGHGRSPKLGVNRTNTIRKARDVIAELNESDEDDDLYIGKADNTSSEPPKSAFPLFPIRRLADDDKEEESHNGEENVAIQERQIDPVISDYNLNAIEERILACKHNCAIALSKGLKNSAQLWNLLSISLETLALSVPGIERSGRSSGLQRCWRDSAVGRLLLKRVFALYEHTADLQLLASAICVLGSPRHVVVLMCSDHPYFSSNAVESIYEPVVESEYLLQLQLRYNSVLLAYCETLNHWNKMLLRTEVYKRVLYGRSFESPINGLKPSASQLSFASSSMSGVDAVDDGPVVSDLNMVVPERIFALSFALTCIICNTSPLQNNWCSKCRIFSVRCGLCHEAMRGAGVYCPACQHGGHRAHMEEWFEDNDYCPTGCGCTCADFIVPESEKEDGSSLEDSSSGGDEVSSSSGSDSEALRYYETDSSSDVLSSDQ